MSAIPGVGPDAEVVTLPNGARQSRVEARFDLLDGRAMFRLARVMGYGATRYEPNNWRGIPVYDHINHALVHIFAYLAGDTQDDHLGHALCRLHMAVAVEEAKQKPPEGG